jgi:hypothetical protein
MVGILSLGVPVRTRDVCASDSDWELMMGDPEVGLRPN